MKIKEISQVSGVPMKTVSGLIKNELIDETINEEQAAGLKDRLDEYFEILTSRYPGYKRYPLIKDRLIITDDQGVIVDPLSGEVLTQRVDTLDRTQKKGRPYLYVSVYTEGRLKQIPVHRIVAECFCDNYWHKNDVHHKNGIFDNRAGSLLKVFPKEHGTIKMCERRSKNLKKLAEDVFARENAGSEDGTVWYTEIKEKKEKDKDDE